MENSNEIFNAHLSQYASTLFGESADLILAILPSALIYSGAGLILAMAILYTLHKKRWYTRTNTIWNTLTKIHYPLWIAIFVIAGFTCGTIRGAGSKAENLLLETAEVFIEESLPLLHKQLITDLPVSSPTENISLRSATRHIMKNLLYTPKSDSRLETLKSQSINWISSQVGEWVIMYAVNALVTKSVQEAGKVLNLSEDDLTFNQVSLIDMDFSQADRSIAQLVCNALDNKLTHLISGLTLKVFIVSGFFTILLLLDPLAYHLWRKKIPLKDHQQVM